MNPINPRGRAKLGGRALLVLVALLALLGAVLALASRPHPTAAQGTGEVLGYIHFYGLKGEATEANHMGWSDIVSFDQGASKASATIAVTKLVDTTSPQLELAALLGTHFKTATLELTKPGASGATVFYRIGLDGVVVHSYRAAGNTSGQPLESLVLKFNKLYLTYWRIDANGIAGPPVKIGWKSPHPV